VPFKILSQSGISLADAYEISGSIAGVEELDPHDVKTVHEMGGTMFSERFSAAIRRRSSGAIAQSIAIDQVIDDLPSTPSRIVGVQVFTAGVAARLDHLAVLVRTELAEREIPIWIYDGTNSRPVRLQDDGAALQTVSLFQPVGENLLLPNMLTGTAQPQTVTEIAIRGLTTAFGAGTLEVITIIHILFSQIAGISSTGLPIPSW